MNNKKLNDNIVKNLYSENEIKTLQALDTIAENGNSNYIPILIDILSNNESTDIKSKIIKILSELKHTDAVPELINAIENEKYFAIREDLIRTCWENGLDFTNHFSLFSKLLIEGSYMVAFEAYTVIESTEGTLSELSAKEILQILNEALPKSDKDRQVLIQHIINFLPEIVK